MLETDLGIGTYIGSRYYYQSRVQIYVHILSSTLTFVRILLFDAPLSAAVSRMLFLGSVFIYTSSQENQQLYMGRANSVVR